MKITLEEIKEGSSKEPLIISKKEFLKQFMLNCLVSLGHKDLDMQYYHALKLWDRIENEKP